MNFAQNTSTVNPVDNRFMQFDLSPTIHYMHYFRRLPFRMKLHEHDFWQLYYVTDGTLTVETAGQIFRVGAGSVHIQPGGIPHLLYSEAGYSQLGIDFIPDERLREVFAVPMTLPLPEMAGSIRRLAALDPSGRFVREQLAAYCSLLLYAAADTADVLASSADASAAPAAGRSPLRRRILDAVRQNPGGAFTVSGLAQELFISPSHLERTCRRLFGESVLALRNRTRFEQACAMLMDSSLSVRSIGESLGFSEVSNFSAFFKRYAGVSPAEYRRRHVEY